MYYLFLDDKRKGPKDAFWITYPKYLENVAWVIVKNYSEFVDCITKNGLPEFLSIDIDFYEEHYQYANSFKWIEKWVAKQFKYKSGVDCVIWLLDYCKKNKLPFPNYVVHSCNLLAKDILVEPLIKKSNEK